MSFWFGIVLAKPVMHDLVGYIELPRCTRVNARAWSGNMARFWRIDNWRRVEKKNWSWCNSRDKWWKKLSDVGVIMSWRWFVVINETTLCVFVVDWIWVCVFFESVCLWFGLVLVLFRYWTGCIERFRKRWGDFEGSIGSGVKSGISKGSLQRYCELKLSKSHHFKRLGSDLESYFTLELTLI